LPSYRGEEICLGILGKTNLVNENLGDAFMGKRTYLESMTIKGHQKFSRMKIHIFGKSQMEKCYLQNFS